MKVEVQKPKQWPKWAQGPLGNRAIFHCAGDVPHGWTIDGEEPVAAVEAPVTAPADDDGLDIPPALKRKR